MSNFREIHLKKKERGFYWAYIAPSYSIKLRSIQMNQIAFLIGVRFSLFDDHVHEIRLF